MLKLRRLQQQLCLGMIALGSSIAIALPSHATVVQDLLILFELEQVTTEGYNPPTFMIEGQSPQSPVGPVPLDWIEPDGELETNPHHPDILPPPPIAPAGTTPVSPQLREVPTHK